MGLALLVWIVDVQTWSSRFNHRVRSFMLVLANNLDFEIHMGQYQLLSVLAARLSPLNIDHSRNLPVEICGVNYTEKYTNL